MVDLLAVQLVV